jgi:hypothetical protein
MFISQKHISRRAVLRGMGVSVALPLIDAMVPAGKALAATLPAKTRLVCIEMVHGSAGATAYGASKNMWSPAASGRNFDLTPTSMSALEPFRNSLTIVSNTDVRMAEAFDLPEVGGDHFRSSAVFLTQAHPKQTQGSDVLAGPSLDQIYAKRFGQDTPIPSMQLCIENIDQAGSCAYGYACVYMDTISWPSETEPLPMVRDPRAVFDQLFGIGATEQERAAHRKADRSILDWVAEEFARLRPQLIPSDRARVNEYLDDIREIERRIQRIEARNSSGEVRELPDAPAGVPDDFEEHVKLMFDLQVLALASEITRVFAFKMGRDASARVYPKSGVTTGFHPASRCDQPVSRQPDSVLPREVEGHAGRRRLLVGPQPDYLWLTHGGRQCPQSQAVSAVSRGSRQRPLEGQSAYQRPQWHPHGQCDVEPAARARGGRYDALR